jgi:pimeloyl-ACP methyl ester carboxylesterase
MYGAGMWARRSYPPGKACDRVRGWRGAGLLVSLLTVLIALALPAPAQGAVPAGFAPCSPANGFYCGTVTVPIDWSGLDPLLTGKTIALHVLWKPAEIADTDGALVALAGGPGQAATPFAADFASVLAPALGTRDLIVFDQRGTGSSAPLDCPGADSAETLQEFVETCASELGPARDHFASKDSAADIDAVRAALGVEQVTVFGISYGTYVAQLYARMFPTHTAALVLDSVVPPNGVDSFSRSNFEAVSRVLAANCGRKLCRGITGNPLADLKRLIARMGNVGIPLRYVSSGGRPSWLQVGQTGLINFMVETFSLDAVARARLPGALRSELAGDSYPLGRLLTRSPSSGAGVDMPLYLATSCTDTHFPWALGDPLSVRRADVNNAFNAISPSVFSPFSAATALAVSNISLCIDWPPTTVDTSVLAPAPDIPVFIFDGVEDDLTPRSDGVAVAALFPRATRVDVPFTGHSVVSDVWPNADKCVARALASFFAHLPIPSCRNVTPFFRPTNRDPSSLAQVKPVRLQGVRGRTIGAVLGTISDVTETALSMVEPPVGLRGGTFAGLLGLQLHKIVYVPGVVVSGSFDLLTGAGRLTVTGKGSHGKLIIRRGRTYTRLIGSLDGKRLSIRVRTSANDSEVARQLPIILGLSYRSNPLRRSLASFGSIGAASRIDAKAFRVHRWLRG